MSSDARETDQGSDDQSMRVEIDLHAPWTARDEHPWDLCPAPAEHLGQPVLRPPGSAEEVAGLFDVYDWRGDDIDIPELSDAEFAEIRRNFSDMLLKRLRYQVEDEAHRTRGWCPDQGPDATQDEHQ